MPVPSRVRQTIHVTLHPDVVSDLMERARREDLSVSRMIERAVRATRAAAQATTSAATAPRSNP